MREKRKYQASKSTSNKRLRRKRDILLGLPHSEFLGIASTFSGLVLSLLFGLTIYNNSYAAEDSITISLQGSVNLNLLGGNAEGSFGTSTVATANVETTNFTGYTLTISGGNSDGALVSPNNPANKIPTIPAADANINEATFRTGAKYMNTWGFRPDHIFNGTTTIENNNYQASPTLDNPLTMDVTNSANQNDPNEYKLALAAKVDNNTPNDSYTGTFTLAATSNGYNYHIGYTDNMTMIPADQYGEKRSESSVNLSSTIPRKDGFVFRGWCSEETTVDIVNGTTCPAGAKVYQPSETINLNSGSANNLLLYAIWEKGYDTFADAFAAAGKTDSDKTNGYYRMQDITPEICDSIVIGSPYTTADIAKNTLIDTRNSKTYLVAKYADGHCWMRENLNLLMTAGSGIEAYNFETKSTFTYTPEQYGTTQTDTGITWEQDAKNGARSFKRDENNCIGGTDINTSGDTGATCDANKPYERIGVLYNWAAATAQTKDDKPQDKTSEVTTSICPKGWRLPANSGDYSFSTLMGSYGLPTTNQDQAYSGQLQNPLNFNRPGYYNWSNGALDNRGTYGRFWSSVGYSATAARYLYFGSTYFYPDDGGSKGHGYSVRCVAV